ncbi:MAG: hypothetical protein AAF602_24860 [Myxococcota bacterium]
MSKLFKTLRFVLVVAAMVPVITALTTVEFLAALFGAPAHVRMQ